MKTVNEAFKNKLKSMKEDRDALTNKLDDQTVTLASFQTDAKILAEKNAQLTTQLVDTQGNLSQFRKHNGILEVELANRTASVNGELKELEQLNIALARHKASDVDAAVREAKNHSARCSEATNIWGSGKPRSSNQYLVLIEQWLCVYRKTLEYLLT